MRRREATGLAPEFGAKAELRITHFLTAPSSTIEFRQSMEQIARCNPIDVCEPSIRVCPQIETAKQF